jgi:diacylglycerol kinase (ATP)
VRLKIVFNPAAGRGRAERHVRQAEEYLGSRGATVELTASSSPDDLTRIAARSSRDGFDAVVVCGGDGSVNLAVRDFDCERSSLAILPFGSGNDLARVCGIPRDVRGACDALLSGHTRPIDVALANDRRYLGVAGLGFDSEVARYANENVRFLRGSAVYLWAIMRVLPQFTPHRVRINGDETEVMFCAIGNSPQYGGGIRIIPSAILDDALLDLCVVHRTSRFELLKTLPKAYTGAHVKSEFVETRRGVSFAFESERPLDVFADGEPVAKTPVTFSVASEKLRLIVPAPVDATRRQSAE